MHCMTTRTVADETGKTIGTVSLTRIPGLNRRKWVGYWLTGEMATPPYTYMHEASAYLCSRNQAIREAFAALGLPVMRPTDRQGNTFIYCPDDLRTTFDKIQDKEYWKNPLTVTGVRHETLNIVCQAIRFFHADNPSHTYDAATRTFTVKGKGYQAW